MIQLQHKNPIKSLSSLQNKGHDKLKSRVLNTTTTNTIILEDLTDLSGVGYIHTLVSVHQINFCTVRNCQHNQLDL